MLHSSGLYLVERLFLRMLGVRVGQMCYGMGIKCYEEGIKCYNRV